MRSVLLTGFLAALALAGCNRKQPLIEVNARQLENKQLDKRLEQVKLLQPDVIRAQAAAGVVEGWVADALLESRGKSIDRDALVSERLKLEGDPKIARLYREVARIYGDDRETFLSVGLLPDIALRRAHELFVLESGDSAQGEKHAAEVLRASQESGAAFESKATDAGATVRVIRIGADGLVHDDAGTQLQLFAPTAQADKESALKLYTIGQRATEDSVLGIVLKTGGGHMVFKRLQDEAGQIKFRIALFPRQSFGAWLKEQAAALHEAGNLRVCVSDELKADYERVAATNLIYCPER